MLSIVPGAGNGDAFSDDAKVKRRSSIKSIFNGAFNRQGHGQGKHNKINMHMYQVFSKSYIHFWIHTFWL